LQSCTNKGTKGSDDDKHSYLLNIYKAYIKKNGVSTIMFKVIGIKKFHNRALFVKQDRGTGYLSLRAAKDL